VQHAHLVVDQAQFGQRRVERQQGLAQGAVERVDRAVATGGGVRGRPPTTSRTDASQRGAASPSRLSMNTE
jgi:hypothetical protein